MKEYEIYIPINYNDGTPVERIEFDGVKDCLLAHFDGISVSPEPIIGYWKHPGSSPDSAPRIYKDYCHVYTIIAKDSKAVRDVIRSLKSHLEESLGQFQIFVTIRDIEIMM